MPPLARGECGAHLPIETVLVHPEVPRRIAQPDESRCHGIPGGVSKLAYASHISGGEEVFPVRQLLIDVRRGTNAMRSGQ